MNVNDGRDTTGDQTWGSVVKNGVGSAVSGSSNVEFLVVHKRFIFGRSNSSRSLVGCGVGKKSIPGEGGTASSITHGISGLSSMCTNADVTLQGPPIYHLEGQSP